MGDLAGRRVLIVEGDRAVADLMERALADQGCAVLGPTATVAGALAWLLATPPDAVVLGVNRPLRWLAGPVAALLKARGVRFVVVTARAAVPDPALRDAPRVARSFRAEELVRAVAWALGAGG